MLLDVIDHAAPGVNVDSTPVSRAKQAMMQLLQPARKDGVRGCGSSSDRRRCSSSSENTKAAFLLDPLADLWSVEVMEVSGAAAAR